MVGWDEGIEHLKKRKKKSLPRIKTQGDSIELSGKLSIRKIVETFENNEFDQVNIDNFRLIDLEVSRAIAKASIIKGIDLRSPTSRAALSVLMQIPGLRQVFISEFQGHGRLRDFAKAAEVTTLRNHYGLRTADFFEIAKLPKLKTLIAQFCDFGLRAVSALSKAPSLQIVDFEGVTFTDEMAAELATSNSIKDVMLPCTNLSLHGLSFIARMQQLRYLDVWANGFSADDLKVLAGHPKLEKIELGGAVPKYIEAHDIIPILDTMPALKTVYFEGVNATDEEVVFLKSRYEFRLLNEW
jgi:hypothetical protein